MSSLQPRTIISDELMRQTLSTSRPYCLVILKTGPRRGYEEAKDIIWEHGRRNFAFRADGLLPIICAIPQGGQVEGVVVYCASMAEVKQIMDEDPAIQTGVLLYELYACKGFLGNCFSEEE